MATHPDQAIKLIKNLDKETLNLLKNLNIKKLGLPSFRHFLMPKNKKTWSSWNYMSNDKKKEILQSHTG